MNKERIIGFDLARVIAIFVVIGIYHNLGYTGLFHAEPAVRVLVYSSLGVFTFLSAFLLTSRYSFLRKGDVLHFYKKRVLRIWPLFAISSIMLAILGFNSWTTTLKGIVGISPFWAPHPTTMWYVAMLISLYIITPFVFCGNIKSQCFKGIMIMSIIGLLQILLGCVVPRTFNYYTVYLVGGLMGKNFYKNTLSFLQSKKTLVITIVWIVLVGIVFITKNDYIKSFSSVVGIIAILNFCLMIADNIKTNDFLEKSIEVLSYSSFCAYLFHREIIWLLQRLYWPDGFAIRFIYIIIIAVPLSFLCAFYIQKVYDIIVKKINL